MTRLELTNENGKYTVEHADEEVNIEFLFDMFESLLMAATYSRDEVDSYLGRDK